MKQNTLLVLFLLTFSTAAQKHYKLSEIPNPKISGQNDFVSNPDGVLNNVQRLNKLLKNFESATRIEFAIVVVKELNKDANEFDYALNLFRKWGIGKKESNNGLLLFIAVNRKKYRFITGYGVEGDLPDGKLKSLSENYLVPYFKEKDYSQGVESVVKAIIEDVKRQHKTESQEDVNTITSTATDRFGDNVQAIIATPTQLSDDATHLKENQNNSTVFFQKATNNKFILLSSIFIVLVLTIFSVKKINDYAPNTGSNKIQNRIKLEKNNVSIGCFTMILFFGFLYFIFSNSNHFFYAENLFKILIVLYIIMAITFYAVYTRARISLSKRYFDDENYKNELIKLNKKFWWFFVFNPLLLIILLKQIIKQKQLKKRFKPLLDHNNKPMYRVNRDELVEGVPYINKGSHKEEELGVNDYDIWESTDKKEYKVVIWPEDNFDDYDDCPKCNFKTLSKPITITTKAATYSSTGTAKKILKCANCNYEDLLKNIIIPIIVESKSSSSGSSSSSSSSSSGSSSFGGGSSGGGGAGGSW